VLVSSAYELRLNPISGGPGTGPARQQAEYQN